MNAFIEQRKDALLLVARVLLVVLFVLFGWSKLTGFSGTEQYMASTGAPVPALAAIIAIVMELVVGIVIAIGFKTRPLALLAGALYARHRVYRPSLLDANGHGAVHQHDQFL